MAIIKNTGGMNPTAEFISNQHTGNFIEILPDTYMIKGAKNPRGFDQAYAVSKNNRKELVLIDAVEEATREAVQEIKNNGYDIKAILISSESVLRDAYSDLQSISKDAGGADIYMHSDIAPNNGFETKTLNSSDATIREFGLKVEELPASRSGEVLIYSEKNRGMLFTGDSAKGSSYDSDTFRFEREEMKNERDEFELARNWKSVTQDFEYLFPRQGKPAIELDPRTRQNIINEISNGQKSQ